MRNIVLLVCNTKIETKDSQNLSLIVIIKIHDLR